MPYAFDRIMNALNLTDQDGQGQPQQQNVVSSSTEGDLSGGGAATNVSTQAAQPQQATPPPAASNKIISKNANRVKNPTDLSRIQQNIAGAKSAAQNEANAFVASAAQPFRKEKATVTQEAKDYAEGKSSDLLNTLSGQMNPLTGTFKMSDYQVSPDVNLLGTDAGLKELFRRQGDAEYSAGEAALDTSLLGRNQAFQQQRASLLNDYNALRDLRNDLSLNTQSLAEKARQEAFDSYKRSLTDELAGLVPGYEQAAKDREAAFDKSLIDNDAAARAGLGDVASRVLGSIGEKDGEISPFLSADGINLEDYYRPGMSADQTDWRDFIDETDKSKFDRIMKALGRGDSYAVGRYAGKNAGDFGGTFDDSNFADRALNNASARRDEKIAKDAEDERLRIEKEQEEAAKNDELARAEAEKAEKQRQNEEAQKQAEKDARRLPVSENQSRKAEGDAYELQWRALKKFFKDNFR